MSSSDIQTYPVTPERWSDMQALFGPRGACAGCWCMWWRLARSEWSRQQYEANRLAMQSIIESGEIPGLLAYLSKNDRSQLDQPIGWISVAPRQAFPTLDRSPLLKPVDDQPVWSIVCFFVNRKYRRQGLTTQLIKSAVDYACHQGAKIVEGYPYVPQKERASTLSIYTGVPSAFLKAGFVEIARPSNTRMIVRYYTGM